MPRKVAADPTGGIWLGLLNGDLAHYRNGVAVTYRFPHDDAALVNQLLPNPDGSVLAATTYGLIGWKQGKLLTLTERDGLPCEQVYAMTFDHEGNLWLYMECGLGEMMSADLQTWLRNSGGSVSIRTLDVLDGVRAAPAVFAGAAASMDGKLWFANGNFLHMIDPAHWRRNSVPPPVHIEQLSRTARAIQPRASLVCRRSREILRSTTSDSASWLRRKCAFATGWKAGTKAGRNRKPGDKRFITIFAQERIASAGNNIVDNSSDCFFLGSGSWIYRGRPGEVRVGSPRSL